MIHGPDSRARGGGEKAPGASGGCGWVKRSARLHPETPHPPGRTDFQLLFAAAPGQERRDLAKLPPFPETDWFVRISLFSPPLPQSQVKIFTLSTEGGGGGDDRCVGENKAKMPKGLGAKKSWQRLSATSGTAPASCRRGGRDWSEERRFWSSTGVLTL